jgi:hypothetical protein
MKGRAERKISDVPTINEAFTPSKYKEMRIIKLRTGLTWKELIYDAICNYDIDDMK